MRLEEINGTEIYKDVRLGHTWHEIGVLQGFLNPFLVSHTFVEVGVHEGGLSYILMPDFTKYIGIENNCSIIRPEVQNLFNIHSGSRLFCDDCFSDYIWQHLLRITNKIIYCDGGHKALELMHFAGACNPGDILMSHDYWDGCREVFTVDTVVPEVTINDIQPLEDDDTFVRLPEAMFYNTRIIGWRKVDA